MKIVSIIMPKLSPRTTLYFIAFILPILGMMNCEFVFSVRMSASNCLIDTDLFKSYAHLYYNLAIGSIWNRFLPLILYIFEATALVELLVFVLNKVKEYSRSKKIGSSLKRTNKRL